MFSDQNYIGFQKITKYLLLEFFLWGVEVVAFGLLKMVNFRKNAIEFKRIVVESQIVLNESWDNTLSTDTHELNVRIQQPLKKWEKWWLNFTAFEVFVSGEPHGSPD